MKFENNKWDGMGREGTCVGWDGTGYISWDEMGWSMVKPGKMLKCLLCNGIRKSKYLL